MSKIRLKTDEIVKEKERSMIPMVITILWMIAILIVFPVFYRDYYFDILQAKFKFYVICTGVMTVLLLVWGAFNRTEFVETFKKKLNALDICVIVFFAINVISTIFSDYPMEALTGSEGRYGGLLTFGCYCIAYFLISRFWVVNRPTIRWCLYAGIFVALFGITDYLGMNIFHFKDNMDPNSWGTFFSTMGNIDTYTAYLLIPMALSGGMFLMGIDGLYMNIVCVACFFIQLVAMITGNTDNTYLSFAAYFGFIPLVAWKTWRGVRRYVVQLAMLFTALLLVKRLNVMYEGLCYAPTGMFDVFANFSGLKYLAIFLWALAICLIVLAKVKDWDVTKEAPKFLRWIWTGIIVVVVALVVSLLIYVNTKYVLPSALASAQNYLVFDYHWGSGRGYSWITLMDLWERLPWYHKLLGAGPETSGIYMVTERYWDMVEAVGVIFDSPHNEFLQMFFNLGPIGLLSYIGIFASAIYYALKNTISKHYPLLVGAAFVCLCHCCESVVNIVVPMDVGIVFAIVAIIGNIVYYREKE